MRFKQFIIKENSPMGGPPMGMGGGPPGAPPMVGPPMGSGMPPIGGEGGLSGISGMGGDAMGMPPMGGSPMGAPSQEPPVIPKNADVWDVLDHILNKKPLAHDEKIKRQESQPSQDPGSMFPPMPQMPSQSLMQ